MEKKEKIITFNILGEKYKIKTEMDEDTALRIANYVNNQIEETSKRVGYASQTKIAVLAALNIAQELFLGKKDMVGLEKKIEQACKRIEKVLEENN